MRPKVLIPVAAVVVAAGIAAWMANGSFTTIAAGPSAVGDFMPEEIERILQHSPLGPPPSDPTNAVADQPAAATLGQAVFYDPRFSKTGKSSCASCHDPRRGLGDGKAMPDGFPVDRNVPTLWNVAYGRWFFWDGRSDSLWSQALKPLENPRELGGSRQALVHLIRNDARLRPMYEAVFGAMPEPEATTVDRVFANVGKSIEAYERRLLSRRAPFDVFVEGLRSGDPTKLDALSTSAQRGLKIFVGKGNCRLCHSGPGFTDGEFHNLGIPPARGGPTPFRYDAIPELMKDPFNGKGDYSDDREAGTRKLDYLVHLPDSWGQVKTPGLRNVAKTGPYMHQGQFKTLAEVVDFYSRLQGVLQAGHHERTILLPLFLDVAEMAALVNFLESLTDESIDPALLRPPE